MTGIPARWFYQLCAMNLIGGAIDNYTSAVPQLVKYPIKHFHINEFPSEEDLKERRAPVY
jgi:hypothetical protein